MQTLSAEALLMTWEHGRAECLPIRRALVLLSALQPDASFQDLAELTVGERDRQLLLLRRYLFGSSVDVLITCPACGEMLETAFDIAQLVDESPGRHESVSLECQGYGLEVRQPTSDDLLAVANVVGMDAQRAGLLDRMIVRATRGAEDVAVADLPAHVLTDVERLLRESDPCGDIRLNLECHTCRHRWQSVFDIVSFLWKELDAWAIRLLRDVHTLARAYGWHEADILQMRPWRRQCYLEMLGT
jgi:hypothetical protein